MRHWGTERLRDLAKDTQPSHAGTHGQPLNEHAQLSWAMRRLDSATKKHPREGKWTLPERIVRDSQTWSWRVSSALASDVLAGALPLHTSRGPQPPGGRRQATGSAPGPAGCMLGCENCCPGGFCWDQAPPRPQLEGLCRGQRGQPSYSHKLRISSFPPRRPSPLLLPLYYLTSPLARMLALGPQA